MKLTRLRLQKLLGNFSGGARPRWGCEIRSRGLAAVFATFGLVSAGCASGPNTQSIPASGFRSSSEPGSATKAVRFADEAEYLRQQSGVPDWADVAQRMGRVTLSNPDHALAWYNLGVARDRLGEPNLAVEAYRRALSLDSTLNQARKNLTALALEYDDRRKTYSLLTTLVEEDPGAVDARVALASYYLEDKRYAEARELCIEALTYQPKYIAAYCVMSKEALATRGFFRVRLLAAQGLKIVENAACLHEVLGELAQLNGEDNAALDHYEQAIAADPRWAGAHFRMGQIALEYRDYQKALAAFKAVSQLTPNNGAAWVNLGIAFRALGQSEEAKKAYLSAIEVSKESPLPEAYLYLGVLYLKNLGQWDEAEDAFRTYLREATREDKRVYAWLEEARARRSESNSEPDAPMIASPSIDVSSAPDLPEARPEPVKASEPSLSAPAKKMRTRPADSPSRPRSVRSGELPKNERDPDEPKDPSFSSDFE